MSGVVIFFCDCGDLWWLSIMFVCVSFVAVIKIFYVWKEWMMFAVCRILCVVVMRSVLKKLNCFIILFK